MWVMFRLNDAADTTLQLAAVLFAYMFDHRKTAVKVNTKQIQILITTIIVGYFLFVDVAFIDRHFSSLIHYLNFLLINKSL